MDGKDRNSIDQQGGYPRRGGRTGLSRLASAPAPALAWAQTGRSIPAACGGVEFYLKRPFSPIPIGPTATLWQLLCQVDRQPDSPPHTAIFANHLLKHPIQELLPRLQGRGRLRWLVVDWIAKPLPADHCPRGPIACSNRLIVHPRDLRSVS